MHKYAQGCSAFWRLRRREPCLSSWWAARPSRLEHRRRIHQLECLRFLEYVSEVFILAFKKLFLDVKPQADYKLVFETIDELIAKAAVHGGVA